MRTGSYVPARGDLVWLTFDPQAGHEQAGRRPALVISSSIYNRPSGLALFCPITRQAKGYPFEVPLPPGTGVEGTILADQVRSLDWTERRIAYIEKVSAATLRRVQGLIEGMIMQGPP